MTALTYIDHHFLVLPIGGREFVQQIALEHARSRDLNHQVPDQGLLEAAAPALLDFGLELQEGLRWSGGVRRGWFHEIGGFGFGRRG